MLSLGNNYHYGYKIRFNTQNQVPLFILRIYQINSTIQSSNFITALKIINKKKKIICIWIYKI